MAHVTLSSSLGEEKRPGAIRTALNAALSQVSAAWAVVWKVAKWPTYVGVFVGVSFLVGGIYKISGGKLPPWLDQFFR